MSDDQDWGGGEWWNSLPPPPDDDDEPRENWQEDFGYEPTDIPPEPDFPLFDRGDPHPDDYIPEQVLDAWDFLVDIGSVNPAQIRGVAFNDIYEAFEWLQALGLLGFGGIVFSEGFYYPVVGESRPERDNPSLSEIQSMQEQIDLDDEFDDLNF